MASQQVACVVRAHDGKIQHLQNGDVQHEINSVAGEFLPIHLVADDKILLIADADGFVSSHPWPTSFPIKDEEYLDQGEKCKLHKHSVSHMVISGDGQVLITAGIDGVVMFSVLTHIVNGHSRDVMPLEATQSQVLIDLEELSGHKTKLRDLALQISSAKTEAEYSVRPLIHKYQVCIADF